MNKVQGLLQEDKWNSRARTIKSKRGKVISLFIWKG